MDEDKDENNASARFTMALLFPQRIFFVDKPAGKPRQKGHGCRKNSRLSILIKGPNPPMTTTMALENSVCGQQRLQTTAFVDDRALVDDRACGQ